MIKVAEKQTSLFFGDKIDLLSPTLHQIMLPGILFQKGIVLEAFDQSTVFGNLLEIITLLAFEFADLLFEFPTVEQIITVENRDQQQKYRDRYQP